jgi:outer membrane receptor protein involved in Fe transport
VFAKQSAKSAARTYGRGFGLAAFLLASVSATGVMAQSQGAGTQKSAPSSASSAGAVDEVVVTGSRIKRAGFDTLQPAIVVGSQLIEERGATNVADVLNEQPAFAVPGSSSSGDQSATTVGQNFVNFLGLGSQRTLVLVNGQRFPGSNSPAVGGNTSPGLQVDLNTIPSALIERVETIAVGGAPIYGADAIAGTVNIILKQNFTGFESNLTTGITEHNDAQMYRAQALFGKNFAQDRGNLVLNVEYDKQDGLTELDREQTAIEYGFEAPVAGSGSPFLNVMIPNSRVAVTNTNGFPIVARNQFAIFGGGVTDGAGNILQFTPSGDLVPFNKGIPTGSPVFFSGGDGEDLAEFTNLLTSSERYYANAFLNFRVSDDLKLHAEGWYSRSQATSVANQPEYNAVAFGKSTDTDARPGLGPLAIRLTNPYLSPSARAAIAAATGGATLIDTNGDGVGDTSGFYLDKGFANVFEGNPFVGVTDLYRALAQASGDVRLFGQKFDWDATYSYGRTVSATHQQVFIQSNLVQAIDSVADPSGTISCRDASNGCVPLNPFGNGPVTDAVRDFVTDNESTETTIQQHVASANITGSPFSLPAGKVGFAGGVEYRYESSRFTPDALAASDRTPNAPLTAVAGDFSSKEVYAETTVPLLSEDMNIPLVYNLELEGAVRYVDNSSAGGALTYTGGGKYSPVRDIELRGNFTHSIRSPAITELFLPTAQEAVFANDPCDARFVNQGNNPAVRAANCAAAGIKQPFGSIIVNASQIATVSGNPDLKNEEANSWTVGAVVRPRFIPGLTVSADWVNIKLTNAIEALDATTILQACYDSTSYPTAAVCGNFGRDASGQVIDLRTGYENAGLLHFDGLTADAAYRADLGSFGNATLALSYLYTGNYELSVTGSDFTQNAGQIGYSKHRLTGSVSWSKDLWRVFLQAQYIGGAKFNNADQPNTRDISGLAPWIVFNSSITYSLRPSVDLQLSVNNLLDNSAPKYVSAGGGAAIATYFSGIIGRSYTFTIRTHF